MKSLTISTLLILCFASVFAARPEPQVQIDTFLKTLGAKGAPAAMAELSKGTLLEAQKGSQIEAFAPQLEAAFKIYGKVARVENVDKKFFGESFVRSRLVTGAPLFWEFMFFRNKDEWQVYVFQFNDQFKNIFGESTSRLTNRFSQVLAVLMSSFEMTSTFNSAAKLAAASGG